jgi:hypothetical protein
MSSDKSAERAVRRLKAEFNEMPGLKLTEVQASKLSGLDVRSCSVILERLVEMRFLSRTRDGGFILADRAD